MIDFPFATAIEDVRIALEAGAAPIDAVDDAAKDNGIPAGVLRNRAKAVLGDLVTYRDRMAAARAAIAAAADAREEGERKFRAAAIALMDVDGKDWTTEQLKQALPLWLDDAEPVLQIAKDYGL